MGEDEKLAQIGRAVQEYQDAKINLAHLDKKNGEIADVYILIGTLLGQQSSFNTAYLRDRQLRRMDGANIPQIGYLMNTQDLIGFLSEREQARIRLKSAGEAMRALGITNLE